MSRLGNAAVGAGAIAVLVVGAWIYGELRDHRARIEERAAAREQLLRDSTAWADSLEVVRRAADSAAQGRAAADSVDVGRLTVDAAAAAAIGDSLLEVAAAQVADSVAQLLVRARGDFAAARAKQDSALAKERDRSALFYQRWQSADSAAARWRSVAHRWQGQSDYWRDRQPSTLERVLVVASCAAMGFAGAEREALVAGGAGLVCLLTGT